MLKTSSHIPASLCGEKFAPFEKYLIIYANNKCPSIYQDKNTAFHRAVLKNYFQILKCLSIHQDKKAVFRKALSKTFSNIFCISINTVDTPSIYLLHFEAKSLPSFENILITKNIPS